MSEQIRIYKLVSLIETEGTDCTRYWDTPSPCIDCSKKLRYYCSQTNIKLRIAHAKFELNQIPKDKLFEVLL